MVRLNRFSRLVIRITIIACLLVGGNFLATIDITKAATSVGSINLLTDVNLQMPVFAEYKKHNLIAQTNNLLANGSFERGADPGQSLKLNPGSTAITGWVVTRAPIDYVGTLWQAANGTRSLDLDGAGAGGIAQTFDTVPGQSYVVTFRLAGNPLGAPPIKLLGVTAAGQSADFAFSISGRTPTNMGWETKRWMFMAQSNKTTLEFFSLNASGGSWGPALDSVLVVVA